MIAFAIVAKNEQATIGESLESARKAIERSQSEVFLYVVDNGSNDATPRIAAESGVAVFKTTKTTMGSVRNFAAACASSDRALIILMDGDCLAPEDLVITATQAFQNYQDVGLLGGYVTPPSYGTWVETMATTTAVGAAAKLDADIPGGLMATTRAVFQSVGGFDEQLTCGEDDDYSRRVRQSGFHTLQLPSLTFVHLGFPKTLLGYADRQIWQVSGQVKGIQTLLDPTVGLGTAYLTGLVLSSVGATFSPLFFLSAVAILAVLPGAYLGYRASKGSRWKVAQLPAAFILAALYLLGRGVGFFIGLLFTGYRRTYKR